jgi:hypothetical protein
VQVKPSDQFLLFQDGVMVGDRVAAAWNSRYTGQIIELVKKFSLIVTVRWDFGSETRLLFSSLKKL